MRVWPARSVRAPQLLFGLLSTQSVAAGPGRQHTSAMTHLDYRHSTQHANQQHCGMQGSAMTAAPVQDVLWSPVRRQLYQCQPAACTTGPMLASASKVLTGSQPRTCKQSATPAKLWQPCDLCSIDSDSSDSGSCSAPEPSQDINLKCPGHANACQTAPDPARLDTEGQQHSMPKSLDPGLSCPHTLELISWHDHSTCRARAKHSEPSPGPRIAGQA